MAAASTLETAPPAVEEKKKWYKVLKPLPGHDVGDMIRVAKSQGRQLVERGEAEATKNPLGKELKKANAELLESLRGDAKALVKEQLDAYLKTVEDAKKTFPAPLQGLGAQAYGDEGATLTPSNPQWDVGRLGKDFRLTGYKSEDGQPILEPVGLERFGSGVGMGHYLCDLFSYSRQPTKELQDHICAKWKVKSTDVEVHTKTALAEASGATGGYTVPTEYAMRLFQLVVQQSVIRPGATIIPMGARSIRIPFLDVTTVQASGVTAFLAGLQMYWTEEAQTRTETEPTFKQLELVNCLPYPLAMAA